MKPASDSLPRKGEGARPRAPRIARTRSLPPRGFNPGKHPIKRSALKGARLIWISPKHVAHGGYCSNGTRLRRRRWRVTIPPRAIDALYLDLTPFDGDRGGHLSPGLKPRAGEIASSRSAAHEDVRPPLRSNGQSAGLFHELFPLRQQRRKLVGHLFQFESSSFGVSPALTLQGTHQNILALLKRHDLLLYF